MKPVKKFVIHLLYLAGISLVLPLLGTAETAIVPEQSTDKTLSPFFFVQSDDPAVDKLPLKSTRADVVISGVIADVEVTQVYKNEGKNTLEAIYIFPGSSRSAVYAMRMTIGERTIEATIQERQQARETYEQALAEGKTASLLEQQRPNVFQMNVGNILPGDEIKVKLNYTELLVPEDATYEFAYPTVVGPRYSNQTEETAGQQDKWVANPYLRAGQDAPFTFAFALTLNSGLPIARLTSPSHDIDVEYTGKNTAQVGLRESNKTNNRDVVIRYSLAGDKIESGLLMNIDKKEDFFLLMLEPPGRVASGMIVPREYIFIIDVSGSMHGFPLEVTKALMQDLLGNLRPNDFFNVMLFSGDNSVLAEKSLPATRANLQQAIALVNRQQGGGGTELMPALQRAMSLPRAEENVSRSMIIVTDGYVTVEKDAFEYIGKNLNKGNVFSFGIGSGVNRFLIEGLARAGMGEPFVILNQEEAQGKAKKFREYIESPILTDITITFNGLKVSDVEPAAIPDLFAKKPVVVFGKYHGTPRGTIVVSGKAAGKTYKQEIRVSEGEISTQNKALRYLWARHRIIRLADMVKLSPDDKQIKEVTQLGLDYNLLTDYTSFVAVDTEKRTAGKPKSTVKQPLPLPQGVSDYAVGGKMSAAAGYSPASPAPMRHGLMKRESMAKQYQPLGGKLADTAAEPAEKEAEERPEQTDYKTLKQNCRIIVRNIDGRLDKSEVEKAVARQSSYIAHVIAKEGAPGRYEIEIAVDAQGKIEKIDVLRDTFNNKELKEKITRLVSRLQFKATQDGQKAKIILVISTTQ
ncbi:VWA domain-containing protein [candidate division FCPU426 bacterium]|nr:VWA domain-containing protein [candidate division FCPU426 bacterium]